MRICMLIKGLLLVVAVSLVLAPYAFAIDGGLSLPTSIVRIEVVDGAESYFDTMLTEVPNGYDVTNATYHGWCVDIRTEMTRSPATHEVFLYSSTDPPGTLADEAWNFVNYILNHKQGNAEDVQQAIWYFMYWNGDGNYTPSRTTAWAIINDTLQNGNGYVPGPYKVEAVICYPVVVFPNQPDVQISIIEVERTSDQVVPELPTMLALTMVMFTVSLAILVHKKKVKTSLISQCLGR